MRASLQGATLAPHKERTTKKISIVVRVLEESSEEAWTARPTSPARANGRPIATDAMSARRAAQALVECVHALAATSLRASPACHLSRVSFASLAGVPRPPLCAIGGSAARFVRREAALDPPSAHASALAWRRGKKKKTGKSAASVRDDSEDDTSATGGGKDGASDASVAEYDETEIRRAMESALESLERDLGKLRVGRASPGMLENLTVDAYGEPTPLQHLGSVAARDAQTLAVLLYDPSLKGAVTKAIAESPLGFNPRDDGDTLIVPVPEMTRETKREVGKMAQRAGESAKISVRNARKRGMDAIKKAKMPEDDAKRAEKALQKLHDDFVKRAGDAAATKEKAIVG